MCQRIRLFVLAFLMVFGMSIPAQAASKSAPVFVDLVEKLGPAVVNISTVRKVKGGSDEANERMLEEFQGTPFYDMFRQFMGPQGQGNQPDHDVRSLGSGFVIGSDGYIITNNHVIDKADEIVVRFTDRTELKATLVGADEDSDLALLKVDGKDLQTLKLANANDIKVGEWVIAIGSPFGFDNTVTAGIISATGRSFTQERYVPFLQTDVAINPGNSGGPLIDMDGNVVGVNSHIVTRSGQYAGLSFAIPVDIVETVVKQLKDKGKVTRGWLGLMFQDMNKDLAQTFGLNQPRGALVTKVMPEGPAAKSGIQQGDVIVSFNGEKIQSAEQLPYAVGRLVPNVTVPVEVIRDKKSKTLQVQIGLMPAKEQLADNTNMKPGNNRLGMSVRVLTPQEKASLEGDVNGLVIVDLSNGPAASAGVHSGDLLVSLNNQAMNSLDDFKKVIAGLKGGDVVQMLLVRPGVGQRYVAIVIPKDVKDASSKMGG